MNFIFPKNYNFKSKLLGFIDYSTAILDSILGIIIYFFVNLIFTNITIKIYVFISLFCYMFKFVKNQNVYLYSRNYKK